jgi:hypothetical protein
LYKAKALKISCTIENATHKCPQRDFESHAEIWQIEPQRAGAEFIFGRGFEPAQFQISFAEVKCFLHVNGILVAGTDLISHA